MEDYKQKYESALEWARNLYNSKHADINLRLTLEDVFPELEESEDERIRKVLVDFFKDYIKNTSMYLENVDVYTILDWLEKQDEQKPTEYTLKDAADIFLDALSKTPYNNKPITDAQVITRELLKFLSDVCSYNPNAFNEQKPTWSEEDEKQARQIERIVHDNGCTHELQKKIADWLKSIKNRVKPQPKQEWSEEDEMMVDDISRGLKLAEPFIFTHDCQGKTQIASRISWLKSIKERYTWKPSERQLEALHEAIIRACSHEYSRPLLELEEDLRRL